MAVVVVAVITVVAVFAPAAVAVAEAHSVELACLGVRAGLRVELMGWR